MQRRGKVMGWAALASALALAACGSEAPPAQPMAEGPPPIEQDLPVIGQERRVLAFGDSLFAGYQLAEHEGYPEKLEVALRTQGINARVIDAGVSGDTSAAARQRIAYVLDNLDAPPHLAMVELGGNDLLRGITPDQTRANIKAILDELKARGIPIVLMGMRAPPNMGPEYQAAFDALYPALAAEYDAALVPFFLEPVVGRPDLNQQDRIHPTAEGIDLIVAATVATVAGAIPAAE